MYILVFFNIAHMTNTPAAVDWAIKQGANGLEIDMGFTSSGYLTKIQHGSPCDCTCLNRLFFPNSVCKYLKGRCNAESNVKVFFRHIVHYYKQKIALVVIDSKIDGTKMSHSAMMNAAVEVVEVVKYLYELGFQGKVIIGAPKLDALVYIKKVASLTESMASVHFTIDQEMNNVEGTLKALVQIPNKNRVYGTGISACGTGITDYTYTLARLNKKAGVVGLSYLWTIDKTSSFEEAIQYFDGIMTNYPGDLAKVLRGAGIGLATPFNALIPPATNIQVISSCDCDYHPGGCSISKAATPGFACKCIYVGAWTCDGKVTSCRSSSSSYCKNPTKSVQSCTQGGGDCLGYHTATCDCNYRRGGCTISKLPPSNTACRCSYRGFWTCKGYIAQCADFTSKDCKSPGYNKNTCRQGGGDCGGY